MTQTFAYSALAVLLIVVGALALIAVLRSRGVDLPLIGDGGGGYEGDLVLGFETSSFVPCDKTDTRYWLVWTKDVDIPGELAKLGFDGPYAEVHLRFDGKLETGSPTGYGHLGQYAGQIKVTKLREMSREGTCE